MAYRVEIRPLAAIEIIEAFDWYELQKSGLGFEFLDELELFYANLLRNPYSHSYFDEPIREGKINRFPFIVVYEVFEKSIVVYSVFMTKRDPGSKRTG
jgi:toxin ParE1/3/4